MRKNAKRRSFGRRFFDACLTGVSRMALAVGDMIARNPVVAGGATAFLVTLGFVASNAIWYQPQAHDNVFFKTRPEQVFRATVKDTDTRNRLTGAANHAATAELAAIRNVTNTQPSTTAETQPVIATLPNTTVDGGDLPALAPNGDKDVAILQYNLKQLGFYDGGVDGLTGPQTRKALEQWQSVQAKLAPASATPALTSASAPLPVASNVSASQTASIIPANRPTNISDNTAQRAVPVVEKAPPPIMVRAPEKPAEAPVRKTALAQPSPKQPAAGQAVSAEELVRIQAGLKAFGNDMVVVDGVPDKSTEDAIREFQKLFRLNVSGKPDPELIGKMREIGLIG
ncbi:peptidoglycan-binding protein [Pseudochrobactrum sp. MP213Fo]|uniref:peptidoglycan-binding domain-containing protein n=1 Tax=Pseudochrobactrum sp. MP213Fo TaxID=3022250 RepID=UPI003B9DCF4E